MQGRRIQKVGPSTLAVSLPSEWIKEKDLKKGDLVFFIPEPDNSLRLQIRSIAEHEKKQEEFIVNSDLCDQPGLLERIIVGNYLLGRDMISIISSKRINTSHIEEIRRVSRKLIGLGIIEETPMRIILQCSIDPVKFPIYMVVRRLYTIASTMHRETIQALLESNIELAQEAVDREDDADTMHWLASRLLYSAQRKKEISEKIGLEKLNLLNVILIVGFLERIADWSEKIGINVIAIEKRGLNLGNKFLNEINNLNEEAFNIYSKAMESIFTRDIKLANTAIESYKKFIEKKEEELVELLSSHFPDSVSAANLRHILWGIRRIAELGAEIAETSIDQALEKSTKICKELTTII